MAFDFDGVILESTHIKTEAFRELFVEYPAALDSIIKYHVENGGISRFIKFRFIYENLIKQPYSQEIENKLAKKFEGLVMGKVLQCPFVDGALEVLEKYSKKLPLYIVSGIPDGELKQILLKRGLRMHFSEVFGSSKSKQEWLNDIIDKNQINPENLLFVGDALSDYYAGIAAKVTFIGRLVEEKSPFPQNDTLVTIRDLRELVPLIEE